MNILVTGGSGFIGSHVCELLIKKKHKAIIIDDLSSGSLDNLLNLNNSDYKFYNSRLEDFNLEDLNEIDGVIHLAAQASVPYSISNFYVSIIFILIDYNISKYYHKIKIRKLSNIINL